MHDIECPASIKGEVLDNYLSRGWFRIGSIVYTTSYTSLDDDIEHLVCWLRYKVKAVQLCRKNNKLISENSNFTTHCHPLENNHEPEQLFKNNRTGVKFKINPSLSSILSDPGHETFDSYIMEVRNNGCLIAAGIFDVGHRSMEDIINFYDPAYKRYSLGKYLMLKKYQYCLENGYDYYYPGYFIPGQQILSYKLFLDEAATEVYLPGEDTWICYNEF